MAEQIINSTDQQLEYTLWSRNEEYSYSPAVQKLYDLTLTYFSDAEEAAKNGQNVIWAPGFLDSQFVYACDAIPLAISEASRLGSPDVLAIADDYFQMPRETCPMIKVNMGEWYTKRNGPIKKILMNSSACEPFNVSIDIIADEGYDTRVIESEYRPPHLTEERFEQLVRSACKEFRDVAVWISGHELDDAKLDLELRRRNRICQKVRRVLELRQSHPSYIKSFPTMYLVTGCLYYFGKPDEYEEMLDMLIAEMEALKDGEYADDLVPLVWSGSRGQEYGVYKAVDEAGGVLLGWMCTMPFATDIEIGDDPVRSLVVYRFGGQSCGNTRLRAADVEAQVKRYDAKGIISYGYVGCSYSGVDRELMREYFKKRGIPSLVLDGSYQVGPASGQDITRIRAFVEMLSN